MHSGRMPVLKRKALQRQKAFCDDTEFWVQFGWVRRHGGEEAEEGRWWWWLCTGSLRLRAEPLSRKKKKWRREKGVAGGGVAR